MVLGPPQVTLVSDIQGAEFPVFAHLADSGLAGRIDTVSAAPGTLAASYQSCHLKAGREMGLWTQHTDNRAAGHCVTLRVSAPVQLYLECHYLAHSNLIDAVSESSCRQLCLAVAPHVKHFYFWVGEATFHSVCHAGSCTPETLSAESTDIW